MQESEHKKKTKIPLSRVIIYLLLVGALPLLFVAYNFQAKEALQQELLASLFDLHVTTTLQKQKRAPSKLIRHTYQERDPAYLEKELSTLPLLTQESDRLKTLLSAGFHPDEEMIRRRINFLAGSENMLTFTESAEKNYCGMKETYVQTNHPAEVDGADLCMILDRIEGEQGKDKRPQLLVSECRLERRKSQLPGNEAFALQLKIIKRQYQK